MEAIVTGATGFVGRWLVNELVNQNDHVTIIARHKELVPEDWKGNVYVIEASLERLASLEKSNFPKETYDIFFHFAWDGISGMERSDVQRQIKNIQYTCDAVALSSMLHCSRFVNAGSIMEYEAMYDVLAEGARPQMGYMYSTAKLAADFMAKTLAAKEGLTYINAVISNIYGAGENSARFINSTLRKMLRHEDIPLTHGEQLYDFIYVSDAARAIILVGKEGEGYTSYYIGNPKQKHLKEFVLEMREVLGSKSALLFGQIPYPSKGLPYCELDTYSLGRLGFQPEIGFARGIKLTKEWIIGREGHRA